MDGQDHSSIPRRELREIDIIEMGDRCYRILNANYHFEPDDRDDIQQEISMALLRAHKSFDPIKGSWFAYAYRFALGAVKTYYREGVRVAAHWSRSRLEVDHTTPYEELLHEVSTEDSYTAVELEEGLEPFNLQEKRLIVLIMMGYSIRDAARISGISIHTGARIIDNLRIKNTSSSYSPHTDSPQLKQAA